MSCVSDKRVFVFGFVCVCGWVQRFLAGPRKVDHFARCMREVTTHCQNVPLLLAPLYIVISYLHGSALHSLFSEIESTLVHDASFCESVKNIRLREGSNATVQTTRPSDIIRTHWMWYLLIVINSVYSRFAPSRYNYRLGYLPPEIGWITVMSHD